MPQRIDNERERKNLIAVGIFVSIVGAACMLAAVLLLWGPVLS